MTLKINDFHHFDKCTEWVKAFPYGIKLDNATIFKISINGRNTIEFEFIANIGKQSEIGEKFETDNIKINISAKFTKLLMYAQISTFGDPYETVIKENKVICKPNDCLKKSPCLEVFLSSDPLFMKIIPIYPF
ncbi:hypothetical protein AAHN93_14260 [Vandammella animalimorsus]|uniref:hypothetical protein n=1 Tax=Vandammella animalimorsus TaxID=2029117 RepID=UPI001177EA44|nr:hypothetical protein [Vandammella animalimorsus]